MLPVAADRDRPRSRRLNRHDQRPSPSETALLLALNIRLRSRIALADTAPATEQIHPILDVLEDNHAHPTNHRDDAASNDDSRPRPLRDEAPRAAISGRHSSSSISTKRRILASSVNGPQT